MVTPDGAVHVAFQNGQHEAAWEAGEQFESQYLVVTSTDGGQTFGAPVHVADQEDGTRDFPLNDDGRPTLTGMAMRVPSGGNIAADPRPGVRVVLRPGRAARAWPSWPAMITRCTSLAPSQMRSTRSSRKNRSATFSRM